MCPGTEPAPLRDRHALNPLHTQVVLSPTAPRNSVRLQRERVLASLQASPATRAVLCRECSCPSVTQCISELRRMGWAIRSQWIEEREPDGSVSPTVLYSLPSDADPEQLTLAL